MDLKTKITEDMKVAMKNRQSERLAAIRLLIAAVKQKEIDERASGRTRPLSDAELISVIDRMLKQRRDAISQYEAAGRYDLADKEKFEVTVLTSYLPAPFTEEEIDTMVADAIKITGAVAINDISRIMAVLKPQLTGRADMAMVSARVKARLASGTK